MSKVANYVNVMYAGRIIERGTVDDIFYNPKHPYTWGLLSAMPDVNTNSDKLYAIPGNPPNLAHHKQGDPFYIRNEYALNIDKRIDPPVFQVSDTHYVASWLMHEKAPKIDMPPELKTRIDRMKLEASQYDGL